MTIGVPVAADPVDPVALAGALVLALVLAGALVLVLLLLPLLQAATLATSPMAAHAVIAL
jgi:hypothetical protein